MAAHAGLSGEMGGSGGEEMHGVRRGFEMLGDSGRHGFVALG